MKKFLVAYYSISGNSQTVAQNISDLLDSDIFEITNKDYKTNTQKYDVVVVVSPIYKETVVPEIISFIKNNKINSVAFICTYGWSGCQNAFRAMEFSLGKKPISTLEILDQDIPAEKQLKDFANNIK